ncbi:MAG: integral rane sensor hybrid histidine kinase [Acidimicrobiia bacterium]|nr:integral rane sensor hybrid histidine kinase [Acidimicrobiia bacterium]
MTVVNRRYLGMQARVLVVDDDPVQRLVASKLLEICHLAVVVAGDGFTALEALRRTPIDLVLMDCNLPSMSGLDVTRAIRSATSGATSALVPVVAVTGENVDENLSRYLAAGIDDALAKPLRRRDVELLVQRWIHRSTVASPAAS